MSNVVPGLCRSMYLSFRRGQIGQAQRLADVAAVLSAALGREAECSTVKFALSLLKIMSPRVRLPMVERGDETRAEIRAVVAFLSERYSRHVMTAPEDGDDSGWSNLAALSPIASLRAFAERLG